MNNYIYYFLLIISVLFLSANISTAQTEGHDEHPEGYDAHGDHQHELGASLGITHLEHDNKFAPLVHLHYSKRLGHKNVLKHFGLGLGVEAIIFEEMHYNVMGVLNIYPSGGWEISLSPGILFIIEEHEYNSAFAFHAELGYAFDLEFIELGPVVGASFSGDEKHYSVGLHVGKGF